MKASWKMFGSVAIVFAAGCILVEKEFSAFPFQLERKQRTRSVSSTPGRPAERSTSLQKIIDSAKSQTKYTNIYDPAYRVLRYPNGDLPRERGVCTDVLVRAFRAAGIDLQKEVHEDMMQKKTESVNNGTGGSNDPPVSASVKECGAVISRRRQNTPSDHRGTRYQ